MYYIKLHTSVRNDNHCPTCRLHHITLKYSSLDISDGPKWVDEWVRRSNGDLYHTFKIIVNETLALDSYDVTGGTYINPDAQNVYLALSIFVDKEQWCPDNICFKISFHENIEEAYAKILYCHNEFIYDFARDVVYDVIGPDFIESDIESTVASDVAYDAFTDHERDLLKECSGVWKTVRRSKHMGNHYQILKLKINETITLNSFCEKIQESNW